MRGSGAEEGGDDSVGDIVELGDGGSHAGCQVTILLLVPLGPDAAQAVEGHHADKQLLHTHEHTHTESSDERTERGGLEKLLSFKKEPTASSLVSCSATSLAVTSMRQTHWSSPPVTAAPLFCWQL